MISPSKPPTLFNLIADPDATERVPPQLDPVRLAVLTAVADKRASWIAAFEPKRLAAELRLNLSSVYRKMDSAEAFIRWLIVSDPVASLSMLSDWCAAAASCIRAAGGSQDPPRSGGCGRR